MNRQCAFCKKVVEVLAYREHSFRCCSRECLGKYLNNKKESKNCLLCGTAFLVGHFHKKTGKYCSRQCYRQSLKGKGHITFTCEFCGETYLSSPSRIGKRKFCSSSCYGQSKLNLHAPHSRYRSRTLQMRPKQCERCGFDAVPEILIVHHKDRNRSNNHPDNLIVLCPTCHEIEHWLAKDGRWTSKLRCVG